MAILDDTREDWNARAPLWPRTSVAWADRIGVSWHWIGPGKGPSAAGPHSACLAQVRDWQWQHQHKPAPDGPWKDIGYNVLICQHARAIEGRGLTYAGSHSPGVNHAHVGVQFMVGSDTPGGASPTMLARAVKLRADIGALGKNIRRDWRHKDDPKASTECCGPQVGAWVLAGGPTKSITPITEEDEVTPENVKEITAALLSAKAVPANMLVADRKPGDPDNLVSIPRALDLVMRWALEGRDQAIVAAKLAEAAALKGDALTPEEVEAIASKVGEKLAAGFDVEFVPKEPTP